MSWFNGTRPAVKEQTLPKDAEGRELAVKVEGLTKTFSIGRSGTEKLLALKAVDLEARSGELLMIVGPSGCGKTTLLSIVAGTLSFDSGKIDVFGSKLHEMSSSRVTAFRAKSIGFIFQSFNLIPTLTCTENVSVPLLINGIERVEAEKRAEEMLAKVGLGGRGSERPNFLSGGQQQRVAIARALVHEPRLVICDEPTSALDSQTGATVMELLRTAARKAGRAVIIVTHDNRAYKYADRIVEMEDGKVLRVHEDPSEMAGHS
ncbi:MAG: ABC transporter ATP-binding protein [Candidatus Methylacidiphilales bacterium]|nr:ABC transporter ATP-binding protein [Candidatus Methylacidiphilales bacterium]